MTWTRWGKAGRRAWSLTAAIALAAASASGAAAGEARAGETRSDPGVLAARVVVDRDPAAVRDYWTARRMRRAEPADLSLTAAGRLRRAPTAAAGQPARAPAPRSAIQTTAANTSFPERVHGKVFFSIAGGTQPGNYVCSGTVVDSNSHALVWTAGHCVHDPEFGGGFATNWIFVPGLRNGERPFGSWPARELFTTRGWRSHANLRLDLGAASLARDEQGRGIEDVLGAREIAFDRSRPGEVTALGYPALINPVALPPRFDFDGQRLYGCPSPVIGSDAPPGHGPETLQIACDMTGGASGGGWVTAAGAVNGVTSYGYATDGNHLYGPYLGRTAKDLYRRASGSRNLCAGREVTNLGAGRGDDFDGTDRVDAFVLKGAADRVAGGSGNDAACGGRGADRLRGDRGRDELRGGPGEDLLVGGPGRDTCAGGPGRDRARDCEIRRQIP